MLSSASYPGSVTSSLPSIFTCVRAFKQSNQTIHRTNLNVNSFSSPNSKLQNKTSDPNFLIFHQNIQHFPSRKLSLEIIIDELKPNILVLTEHKLNSDEIKSVQINNYVVKSFYCRDEYRGGGVMILSHKTVKLNSLIIPEITNLTKDKEFECCIVKCSLNKFDFILVGVYRTPGYNFDNPFLEKLNKALEILTRNYPNIIVAGDVNIDVLRSSNVHEGLAMTLKEHNMYYLVNFPTRITSETESAIDNFFTNIPKHKLLITGVITEISDHDAQLLELKNCTGQIQEKNKPTVLMSRNFNKENTSTLIYMLKKESWLDLYMAPVETKFDVFYNIFRYYFDSAFPLVKNRIYEKREKWITNDIIKQKEEIICLSQTIRLTKDKTLKLLLNKKKKEYNKNLINAKKQFIDNKIKGSKNICKTTWQIINKEIKDKPEYNEVIKLVIDDKIVSDPQLLSEEFNNYFVNVVDRQVNPKISMNSKETKYFSSPFSQFNLAPIEDNELDKILASFENKFSVGYDDIPMPILKSSKLYLIKPLAHIINSSFVCGIFPDKLKISRVKAVFKKGNKTDPSNYRPISLISSFSKLFERVMATRLMEYLETNQLLDDAQHGFRSGKSVVTAGSELIESIITALDRGDNTVGIFMDLTKAFDSVCHDKLICTLQGLGISGRSLNWFGSYLQGRKQYVEISYVNKLNKIVKVKSSMETVSYGVPQGSILGPILFLCYLKGLPSLISPIHSKLCLYADDSNLIVNRKTKEEVEITAHNQLTTIKNFFDSRNLLLNLEKTNFIYFHTWQNRNKQMPTLRIDSNDIQPVEHTKFLGLIVDKHVTWNDHIVKLKSKMSSGLFVLRTMSKYSTTEVLKMIYFAHIHSHLSYGIVLYGATSNKNLESLLILQKKSLRIILNLNDSASVKEYFPKFGILTVYGLYILETVMALRAVEDDIPRFGTHHNYPTRNRSNFETQAHSLELFWKIPKNAGIKFYRNVPQTIKAVSSLSLFRLQFKKYLINKAFYSFEEYLNC